MRVTAAVVLGAAWTAAVCAWPALPGGGGQSSLLIAVASIMATLVVLMLTLGSIALQVLSEFSWQLTRTVLDKWLAAGLALSVVAGEEDPRLLAANSALAELVGSLALPHAQLRPAVVTYAAVRAPVT